MKTHNQQALHQLHQSAEQELTQHILPYWQKYAMDTDEGGYWGDISHHNEHDPSAPKGIVMHGRFAWTYSAAYLRFGDPAYLAAAEHAVEFILKSFLDEDYGGVYWSTDRSGIPADDRKHFYGIAFALYGLSEYVRAAAAAAAPAADAGNRAEYSRGEILSVCLDLYRSLEEHGRDQQHGGYLEACSREWGVMQDTRLSSRDLNCAKSMNTNLHVLEALSSLYRIYPDNAVAESIRSLVRVTIEQILDRSTGHLRLFFTREWNSLNTTVSYGHDIEASWLLWEAAEVIGDHALQNAIREAVIRMVQAVHAEAFQSSLGGVVNEKEESHLDTDIIWWVQAESVIGLLNAYEMTGEDEYLQRALQVWNVIQTYIADRENGEWKWGVDDSGNLLHTKSKGGFWKTPYHNGRACMEIMQRTQRLLTLSKEGASNE